MRHKLAKLYMNDAQLIWNGNRIEGAAAIQKFYEELPVSLHSVRCFDSQPVHGKFTVNHGQKRRSMRHVCNCLTHHSFIVADNILLMY